MGYKVERRVFNLKFQGTELDGLEVLAHSLNTGQFLELEAAKAERAEGGQAGESATQRMLELLAGALVSWNAEDEDDQPIPATMAGILSQDLDFNMKVIEAWTAAIGGVKAPLPQTSADGKPSVEASIPMDVPSPSLAS